MLRLSHQDLKDMAVQLLVDYYGTKSLPLKRFDVDDFARNYMRLAVRFADLSAAPRTVLGATAYTDTILKLNPDDPSTYMPIKEGTVFLSDTLRPKNQDSRRRFTLAHECSHQAIYLLNPEAFVLCDCRTPGQAYSLRELATANDWAEWQANALAAELLMSPHLIYALVRRYSEGKPLRIYPDGRLLFRERRIVRQMTQFLGVSRTALMIQLQQLSLLDYRSREEYLREEEIDSLIAG